MMMGKKKRKERKYINEIKLFFFRVNMYVLNIHLQVPVPNAT